MAIFSILFGIFSIVCLLVALPFVLMVSGIAELIAALPYIIATIIVLSVIISAIYLFVFAAKTILAPFPTFTKWAVWVGQNLWLFLVALPLAGAVAIFLIGLLISPLVFIVTSTENPLLTLSVLGLFIAGCVYFARKEYRPS